MLEHVFGSMTRARLLAFFFSHPQNAYFTREITRKIRGHLTAVRRELDNLTSIGVLTERGIGRKKFYQVDSGFTLFPELKSLLFKGQVLVELDLIRRLRRIGSLQTVVLTGFFVSDEQAVTDIFLIGRLQHRKLKRLMAEIQRELDHPLRFTALTKKEFLFRYDLGDRFVYDIFERPKIVVHDRLRVAL